MGLARVPVRPRTFYISVYHGVVLGARDHSSIGQKLPAKGYGGLKVPVSREKARQLPDAPSLKSHLLPGFQPPTTGRQHLRYRLAVY
jgi:hypothetical protein